MEDVAAAAGVSRALVSLAYRNAHGVSDTTRDRILAVGEDLGYVPNRVAARLASRETRSFGVFLQDLHNDLFADIHDGIRGVTDEHSRELVITVGALDGTHDLRSLATLQETRVAVIIAAGLTISDADALAQSKRTPMVAVARHIPGVDSVTSDNLHGGLLATEHLLELGHRSIAFLANPPSDGYLGRREGYEQAMHAAGLEPRTVPSTFSRLEVAATTVQLLDASDAPTAIFAHNDVGALGVLDALAARNLTPGVDVSVVGYDNSSVSSAPGTDLTTINLNGPMLGREGALMAIQRAIDPEAEPMLITHLPELISRGTTGAPRGV
ncbi:LacI family DNA-binding transcriptional regulator [Pseudoclavibacter terrae]|uniref:LacI family DNA-binding transcriptional regulator n=1 Tax=Pseudoclavibacter terrae TaxID=1530195 RepID=UPI00232BB320|nr:LacI family DNA-binding transcriptional regulator [Pseudoclavibacter terrae]